MHNKKRLLIIVGKVQMSSDQRREIQEVVHWIAENNEKAFPGIFHGKPCVILRQPIEELILPENWYCTGSNQITSSYGLSIEVTW